MAVCAPVVKSSPPSRLAMAIASTRLELFIRSPEVTRAAIELHASVLKNYKIHARDHVSYPGREYQFLFA
jgi:hypothetical protein